MNKIEHEINESEVIPALTQTHWKNTNDIKNELSIKVPTSKLGRTLTMIARSNPELIALKKQGNRNWFKLKSKPQSQIKHNDDVTPRKLETLIEDLKTMGMFPKDIRKIVYETLDNTRKELEQEMGYISENAPNFKEHYDSLRKNFLKLQSQIKEIESKNTQ